MSSFQLMGLEFLMMMAGFMIAIVIIEALVKKPATGCTRSQATRNNNSRNTNS